MKLDRNYLDQIILEALKKKPEDLTRGTYLRTLVHKAAISGQLNA